MNRVKTILVILAVVSLTIVTSPAAANPLPSSEATHLSVRSEKSTGHHLAKRKHHHPWWTKYWPYYYPWDAYYGSPWYWYPSSKHFCRDYWWLCY